jgi:hypothetical protein
MVRELLEDFDNDKIETLKDFGYSVGRKGSYKTFESRDGYNDITVFIYDDGRVRYDTDDATDVVKLNNDKYSIRFVNDYDKDLRAIEEFINDFMSEYGYIDDGFEVDGYEDEFDEE